jgi:hypothetical protein
LVLTKNVPRVEAIISREWIAKGKNIKEYFVDWSKSAWCASVIPMIIAEIISADMDSKRSAAWPAQSPTLSPTRSAITAGFLWSSSGISVSTFPIRSAPTSAALV